MPRLQFVALSALLASSAHAPGLGGFPPTLALFDMIPKPGHCEFEAYTPYPPFAGREAGQSRKSVESKVLHFLVSTSYAVPVLRATVSSDLALAAPLPERTQVVLPSEPVFRARAQETRGPHR